MQAPRQGKTCGFCVAKFHANRTFLASVRPQDLSQAHCRLSVLLPAPRLGQPI